MSFKIRTALFLLLIPLLLLAVFYFAYMVSNSTTLQGLIRSADVVGMLLLSFILGLNVLLPVHVATFAPIFVSAGASTTTVIICFALGASLADTFTYYIGTKIKQHGTPHLSAIANTMATFLNTHEHWILPTAYVYMLLAPTPNEYIVIPLAIAGIRFRQLLIPLILGNVVHQVLAVYGFTSLFSYFTTS